MAPHIAGVTAPGPTAVLGAVSSVAGWGVRTVRVAAELPERAVALLDGVDALMRRINDVVDRADGLVARVDTIAASVEHTVRTANAVAGGAAGVVDRANAVAGGAARTVGRAGEVAASAGAVVIEAGDISRGASELLTTYQPLATQAAPLAKRFVDELSEQEIVAAVRLVDQLPQLAEHMETDVMPLLATLDRVGPDMHELLDVVKDLREAVNGIPGLAYLRRRGTRPPDNGAHA